METAFLDATLILILLLLVLVLVFSTRNSYLDRVPLLPEESFIWEEKGVRVIQEGRGRRQMIYPKCNIRLSNARIWVSQKVMLPNRESMRYLIAYNIENQKAEPAKSWPFLRFSISGEAISYPDGQRENSNVCIAIPNSLLWDEKIKFHSNDLQGLQTQLEALTRNI
ncbi:MAG: hypothetical protein AAF518_02240 [Spirochaetota bacterium]